MTSYNYFFKKLLKIGEFIFQWIDEDKDFDFWILFGPKV